MIIHLEKPLAHTKPMMKTTPSLPLRDQCFKVTFWMDAVYLKLNESKTEFIYLGSQQLLQNCNTENIMVINEQ